MTTPTDDQPTSGRAAWRNASGRTLVRPAAAARRSHAAAGAALPGRPLATQLTVLVPAYNEGASLGDTIRSLLAQTTPPAEILVIDDCSTDDTAAVASALGVRVLQPPHNTGSKAGAQNFALEQVRTAYTMAIDADTTLAPDAIERLMPALERDDVAAACGFDDARVSTEGVVPATGRWRYGSASLWLRAALP